MRAVVDRLIAVWREVLSALGRVVTKLNKYKKRAKIVVTVVSVGALITVINYLFVGYLTSIVTKPHISLPIINHTDFSHPAQKVPGVKNCDSIEDQVDEYLQKPRTTNISFPHSSLCIFVSGTDNVLNFSVSFPHAIPNLLIKSGVLVHNIDGSIFSVNNDSQYSPSKGALQAYPGECVVSSASGQPIVIDVSSFGAKVYTCSAAQSLLQFIMFHTNNE